MKICVSDAFQLIPTAKSPTIVPLRMVMAIDGILLTMYDTRLRLSNQVATEVKRHFDELVYETIIHRNTKLGEAPSAGKPAILYDADSSGSINYMNLAREIVQKHDNTWVKSADKILDFEE